MRTAPVNSVEYRICHVTRYAYASEVVRAQHWLHLRLREFPGQKVISQGLAIDPAPAETRVIRDAFGNDTLQLVVERPHASLEVTAEMHVRLTAREEVEVDDVPSWESVREQLSYNSRPRSTSELEAIAYRLESPQVKLKNVFGEFAAPCFGKGESLLHGATNLMHKVFEDFTYKPGATNTATPLLEVLEKRHGVCQDYAHLMIACLRSLGLSARYVSGYLRTVAMDTPSDSDDEKNNDEHERLIGADASHAWVAVYMPPFGWIDLDPTNNLIVNTDHITIGWGRDFSDVSPLRGVITGGGAHRLTVGVSVIPVKQSLPA